MRRVYMAGVLMVSCCGLFAAASLPGFWLDVPFVKQEKDGCGAASIAMVMQYWQLQQGQPANPSAEYSRIEHAVLSHSAHGMYASAMEQYFQQNGFSTFTFIGDRDALKRHLEKGRPLIVALKPGSRMPPHYVVVAGLDEDGKVVLLNDPAERKLLKEDIPRFDREWKAAQNWTLLAVPGTTAH